ncbi:MAG: enoyl-CoA hydratase/isomerase family protein [Microthrixaceae bacterium]
MAIITYASDGHVGRIRISRPERRNALNHGALDELHDALQSAHEDQVRVLVVTGDQDQFCSGADLKELEDLQFTRRLRTVLDELAAVPVPTIAAVSGACMGLGLQLSLACDLRLATPDARFAVPTAKLGLMVDHWTVQRLALLAGQSTARWMLLTARPIDAARAEQVGYVHQLVEVEPDSSPGGAVLAAADALAAELAGLAPLTLQGSKLGLDLLEQRPELLDPDGGFDAAFTTAWTSDDLVEGRAAFRDRRPPEFRGR